MIPVNRIFGMFQTNYRKRYQLFYFNLFQEVLETYMSAFKVYSSFKKLL